MICVFLQLDLPSSDVLMMHYICVGVGMQRDAVRMIGVCTTCDDSTQNGQLVQQLCLVFAGLAGIVSSDSLIPSLLSLSTFSFPTSLCRQCRDQASLLGLNTPADILRYISTASITALLSCSRLPFIALVAGSHQHGWTRWPFTHPRKSCPHLCA